MKPSKHLLLVIGLTAYTLSGLNWNLGIASWIAPACLLYFTRRSRWPGFLLLFAGLALGSALSKSAENQTGLFIVSIITGVSYGIMHSLPYILDRLLVRKEAGYLSTLVFPATVVILEYLFSLAYGIWGNPAVSQFHSHILIQLASLTGVFGISFMITWLASTLNWILLRTNRGDTLRTDPGKGGLIYAGVFLAVLAYGGIRTSFFPPAGQTVKVAAVAGDTDIHRVFSDWEEEIMELSANNDMEIPEAAYSGPVDMEIILDRTEEALAHGAKIIVWNEIALILDTSRADSVRNLVKALCREYQAYVLTAFLELDTGDRPKPFNNKSELITPEGELAWSYLKSYPTTAEQLIINRGEGEPPFLDTEYGRIGNVICADLDIPELSSRAGRNKVDILLVPAFDWEEITPYHSHLAAFTAIQYGLSIARSNGKGVIAFYDYHGNILAQANTLNSPTRIVFADLPVDSPLTPYARTGDLLVYLLMLFLAIYSGMCIFGNKNP